MLKFAANISLLFTEVNFMDRFARAAQNGFRGVEILSPYGWPVNELQAALREHSLEQVLINSPAGNIEAGERGRAAVTGKEDEFWEDIQKAIEYSRILNCSQIHVMAGILQSTEDWNVARTTFIDNLKRAAPIAAKHGIRLLIEPINSTKDIPGYFLNKIPMAKDIITDVSERNVQLQFDFYHTQIMHGNLTELLTTHMDIISHIQISNLPDRSEPSKGEINYPYLFTLLETLRYSGWIGCEYRPSTNTLESLDWAGHFGIGPLSE